VRDELRHEARFCTFVVDARTHSGVRPVSTHCIARGRDDTALTRQTSKHHGPPFGAGGRACPPLLRYIGRTRCNVSYSCFELELVDKIGHIKLNRPDQLNSMIRAFWAELPAAVRALDAAGNVRVVVISSSGKHFTAGMDLSVFQSQSPPPGTREAGRLREVLRRSVLELQDAFNALEQARMPVIAAIQGGCIGGGVDMV
jgi:hypothetical protein